MSHILSFALFEARRAWGNLTPKQAEWLDRHVDGTWQLNPSTGLVDVDGDFDCEDQDLSDLKGVRFGVVKGDFYCQENHLTSLVGAPREVGSIFSCDDNELTSLEGAPQEVKGYFSCEHNQLTSLVGAPREVGGSFNCGDNPVSEKTLKSIFGLMENGKSYLEAVESLWTEIPIEDQALLYRPEFKWVGAQEARKLQALGAYHKIKGWL